jgi:hypothetical protein
MLNNKTQHAEYGGGSFLEPFQRDVVISFSCRGYELLRTPACICAHCAQGFILNFSGSMRFDNIVFGSLRGKGK